VFIVAVQKFIEKEGFRNADFSTATIAKPNFQYFMVRYFTIHKPI